jgi:hypothetical protein
MDIKLLLFLTQKIKAFRLILFSVLIIASLAIHAEGTSNKNALSENGISSLPHYEGFDFVTPPALPQGWTKFVQSAVNSVVETSNLQQPNSMPNHVRFRPAGDANAQMILITPPITTSLNQLRVRFYARAISGEGNTMQVGTYDPENGGGFTNYQTVSLTGEYTQYTVLMDQYAGTDNRIAFRAVPSGSFNSIAFDDFFLDEIPTGPVLSVMPMQWDFLQLQTGLTSAAKEFTISNQGPGYLTVAPEDIQITGAHAGEFVLNNLNESVQLGEFESATISISFAPETTGAKTATLFVDQLEVPLQGEGIDATIYTAPYYQDFNNVTIPNLPFGWSRYVYHPTSPNARVETSSVGTPISPPQHVRLYSDTDTSADILLITPPVQDLSSKKISFWARGHLVSGLPDLVVGTMTDPTDVSTFTPFHTVVGNEDLTNVYTQFEVYFNPLIGDDNFIAFKFGGNPMQWTFVYIDDFLLEDIPDEPVIFVNPTSHDFGQSQVNFIAPGKEFSIFNYGGGTLELQPSDISITGDDAGDFVLNNITETIQLQSGESASIKVAFAPALLGPKQATLNVLDFTVALSGEGFDYTITEFPWTEDFSGIPVGNVPDGWVREASNWGVNNSSQAGGNAPEMRFNWSPGFTGEEYLKSPPINTSEFSSMQFSFRHHVNNFTTPGIYTLRVVSIADGVEYPIVEWVDPDNIAAEHLTFTLNAGDHGIGAEDLRLAWIFDGNSEDINRWYIDDIMLMEAYTVNFLVREDAPEATPVAGASILINGFEPLTTTADGTATTDMAVGTYTAEISAMGYLTQEVTFTVDDNITVEVNLADRIIEPFGLTVNTDGLNDGEALFSWQIEFDEFRYDDGVATGQLGFQDGNINSVMGAVHFKAARLHEMTWFLTDNSGPHPIVKVWVLGLDENGGPDRNNVIYTNDNVPNTHMEWNTYEFPEILEAPDGFFIGVSTHGFLALATDDGVGEPWEFVPGTQFAVLNINNPDHEFLPIETWDFHHNFLIRGYGEVLGEMQTGKFLAEEAWFDAPLFSATEVPIETESLQGGNEKVFTGFNVFLNDMETPLASDLAGVEYLFQGLEEGDHTAGVQAVYSTGTSAISTIDFTYTIPVLYSVTFMVNDTDGNPIPDAQITFEGFTHDAGVYFFDELEPGIYDYSVNKDGYDAATGQVQVSDQDVVVDVVLEEAVTLHAVTFNVDMTFAGGFDPEADEVYLSGNFSETVNWPEPGSPEGLVLSRVDGSMIFTLTLELEPGDYEYKYFSNAFGQGWDGGEWEGAPNREITVDAPLVIDDEWGSYLDVSTPVITEIQLSIFPNPAGERVNIVAGEQILEVSLFNIQGQLLLRQPAHDERLQLNVSGLHNGIYLIRVRTSTRVSTKQLQINR